MSAAPPGWYPYGAGQGYWDGTRWTQTLPAAPSPTSPVPTTPYDAPTGPVPGAASYPPPSSPYGAGYPAPYAVAPKNPAVMVIASFFVPGLGSMLNGDTGRGILILVGYVLSWVLTIVLVGFIGLLAFWVWGMVDAYQGAQRWNARHGILS